MFPRSLYPASLYGPSLYPPVLPTSPITLTLTGPGSGVVSTPSTNFTVTPSGVISSDLITPHTSGSGVFTPSTLTFTSSSASQTFTYNPNTTIGSPHHITITDTSGLTIFRSPINYTVTSSPTPTPTPTGTREINLAYMTNDSLYAVVKTSTGQFINNVTPEFYNASHWTAYSIPMNEISGSHGQYQAPFPLVNAGIYMVDIYVMAGSSPAITDGPPIASGGIPWDGTKEAYIGGTVSDITNPVSVDLSQVGLVPRDLGQVSDNQLTLNDALVSAVCVATGKSSRGLNSLVIGTPKDGTTIRTFSLDFPDNPTSRE